MQLPCLHMHGENQTQGKREGEKEGEKEREMALGQYKEIKGGMNREADSIHMVSM